MVDQAPFTGLEGIPKPEAIAEALHLKRAGIVENWETRSGVQGFLAKFLLEKARSFCDDMDFQDFEYILALLIYGLVLFPNLDQFLDVNAIKVFLSRNPIPTLLGDILHCLHTRTMKKRGTILEVPAKPPRELIPLRRVCPRSRRKTRTGARSGRKFKIVETLRNFADPFYVLFGTSMQKFIGRLFP